MMIEPTTSSESPRVKDIPATVGPSTVTEGEPVRFPDVVSPCKTEVRGEPTFNSMPLEEFLRLVKEFGPDPEAADAVEAEIKRARSGA